MEQGAGGVYGLLRMMKERSTSHWDGVSTSCLMSGDGVGDYSVLLTIGLHSMELSKIPTRGRCKGRDDGIPYLKLEIR